MTDYLLLISALVFVGGTLTLLAALWTELTGPREYCAHCRCRAPRRADRHGWRRTAHGLACCDDCASALAADYPIDLSDCRNTCHAAQGQPQGRP